jgi:phage protein D
MLVPDFDVKVNGARLTHEARGDVLSIHVEKRLDTLSMFTITLDNWDAEQQRVSWSDSGPFSPGAEVEISLGWLDRLAPVMTGEVTGIEPRFAGDEPSTVTIRGYDLGHRLTRTWRTVAFAKMKESAIVQQIASAAGLRAVVQDSRVVLEYVLQSNQTDLDFLRSRARAYGWEVFVQNKTLHVRPPAITGPPAHLLTVGAEIAEFSPRLSSMGQAAGVVTRGWDVNKKQEISGAAMPGQLASTMGAKSSGPATAKRAFGAGAVVSTDPAPIAAAHADLMSRGRLDRSALAYVRGEASGGGLPRLEAGTVVRIAGAGTRFSGAYYVTAVTHTLDAGTGLRTSFEVRRNGS